MALRQREMEEKWEFFSRTTYLVSVSTNEKRACVGVSPKAWGWSWIIRNIKCTESGFWLVRECHAWCLDLCTWLVFADDVFLWVAFPTLNQRQSNYSAQREEGLSSSGLLKYVKDVLSPETSLVRNWKTEQIFSGKGHSGIEAADFQNHKKSDWNVIWKSNLSAQNCVTICKKKKLNPLSLWRNLLVVLFLEWNLRATKWENSVKNDWNRQVTSFELTA